MANKDGGPLGVVVLDELSSKVKVALKLFLRSFAEVRMAAGGGPIGAAGMSTFCADFDM